MTKFRLKVALLRAIIWLYKFVGSIAHHAINVVWWFLRFIGRTLGIVVWPLTHFLYRTGFATRVRIMRAFTRFNIRYFDILAHRFSIHGVFVLLVTIIALTSLVTRTVRAETLGTDSILYVLVSGNENDLVQDVTPAVVGHYPTNYPVDVVALNPFLGSAIDFDTGEETISSGVSNTTIVSSGSSYAESSVAPRTTITTYVVADGDTISTIADRFNLSIETILVANKLSVRSLIRPRDILTIPPIDGILYTVRRGDTVGKLATQYHADAHDIATWNNLSETNALAVGVVIVIPGGRAPQVAPTPRKVTSPVALFQKPPSTSSSSARPGASGMIWPVQAHVITQYFSWHHTGVDIAGVPIGTPLYAVMDGVVQYAGWSSGYGYNVVLLHDNGLRTRYAHDSKLYVKKGEIVSRGQIIAALGSTGNSTGPHLHFEVIQGSEGRDFLNPLDYVRYGQ